MAGQPAQSPQVPISTYIGPGNTALVATGLMLPVTGAVLRFVSYRLAGFPDPIGLAVTAPVGELAATGIAPVLISASFLALSWVWLTLLSRGAAAKLPLRPFVAGIALASVLLALVIGPVMAVFQFTISVSSSYVMQHGHLTRQWRGSGVALALFFLFAAAGAAFAWNDGPLPPAAYRFTDSSLDGNYVLLAHDDGTQFLGDCVHRGSVLAVATSIVVTARYTPRTPMGPMAAIRRAWSAPDLLANCPAP